MWRFERITRLNLVILNSGGANNFSTCCKPPMKPSGCGPGKVIGKSIPPPGKCGCRPRFAPNPCKPIHHEGRDTWKKYRNLAVFVCIPLIIVQAMNALSHGPPRKGNCKDYEYMRVRTKRYPWGSGQETYFHNEHVNHLPGECEPPPPDCD